MLRGKPIPLYPAALADFSRFSMMAKVGRRRLLRML
jgi:hypothetical protein